MTIWSEDPVFHRVFFSKKLWFPLKWNIAIEWVEKSHKDVLLTNICRQNKDSTDKVLRVPYSKALRLKKLAPSKECTSKDLRLEQDEEQVHIRCYSQVVYRLFILNISFKATFKSFSFFANVICNFGMPVWYEKCFNQHQQKQYNIR